MNVLEQVWNKIFGAKPIPVNPLAKPLAAAVAQESVDAVTLVSESNNISTLQAKVVALTNQLAQASILSPAELAVEQELAAAAPLANISYVNRTIPGTTTPIPAPIRVFITPNDDEIVAFVSLLPRVTSTLNCQEVALAIYSAHQARYMTFDSPQAWGEVEYWNFPFEMRARVAAGMGGVCHDFAQSIKSCLNAAGIPDFRSRIVVGTANNGEGHATVYFLGDDLKTWRHFNSTNPGNSSYIAANFDGMPLLDDSTDALGISTKNTWFSYNSNLEQSTFDTTLGAVSPGFLSKLDGKLIIEPKPNSRDNLKSPVSVSQTMSFNDSVIAWASNVWNWATTPAHLLDLLTILSLVMAKLQTFQLNQQTLEGIILANLIVSWLIEHAAINGNGPVSKT